MRCSSVVLVLACVALGACSDTEDPSGNGAAGATGATEGASTGSGASSGGGEASSVSSGGAGGGGPGAGGGGGAACELPAGSTTEPHVHVVYLVPTDRQVVPLYASTLDKTIRELQLWYRDHTSDGATFEVHDPVVEVVKTPHAAGFYATNPNGEPYLWFWNNVLDDAFPATSGGFDDPENVWLYYIDADGGCGQIAGGGTSGIAVLPANDLRGLVGEQNVPPCPDDPPDDNPRCRWVGGLGHELGHAFTLPHPPGCDEPDPSTPCDSSALLYLGYVSYPDTHLTDADKLTLASSPFFAQRALPDCALDCSTP